MDFRAAAQLLNVLANDIHADTATGYVGDLFGCRKAWLKDQVKYFVFGQVPGRNATAPCFGQNLIFVQSAPVVEYLNHDVSSLMPGPQSDPRYRRFAGQLSRGGIF